jgi:hypothetical protein
MQRFGQRNSNATKGLINMKKFIPLALVLGVLTAGAAIALARTIHNGATQARADVVSVRPAAAALKGTYLVPNCHQHKPLCDLQTY